MISPRRIRQVFQYGWMHAAEISNSFFAGKKRMHFFIDILSCFLKYGMWSSQYLSSKFWSFPKHERDHIGKEYQQKNAIKEQWLKDFYFNKDFLKKYSNIKFEKASLRDKRNKAYSIRYNAGKNLLVEYDVDISRQHYLDGSILIGDNVLLAKHVSIDYSGMVVIEDNVKLSPSVVIESHKHEFVPGSKKHEAIPTSLIIERGVWVGQNSVICESTKRIGRYAQIGAGSVVRTSIPPYAIVIGNPSKIIGYVLTPEEVEAFEANNIMENPLNIEQYRQDYERSFVNRLNEIKRFTKLR